LKEFYCKATRADPSFFDHLNEEKFGIVEELVEELSTFFKHWLNSDLQKAQSTHFMLTPIDSNKFVLTFTDKIYFKTFIGIDLFFKLVEGYILSQEDVQSTKPCQEPNFSLTIETFK
jgi:hypothetical protein